MVNPGTLSTAQGLSARPAALARPRVDLSSCLVLQGDLTLAADVHIIRERAAGGEAILRTDLEGAPLADLLDAFLHAGHRLQLAWRRQGEAATYRVEPPLTMASEPIQDAMLTVEGLVEVADGVESGVALLFAQEVRFGARCTWRGHVEAREGIRLGPGTTMHGDATTAHDLLLAIGARVDGRVRAGRILVDPYAGASPERLVDDGSPPSPIAPSRSAASPPRSELMENPDRTGSTRTSVGHSGAPFVRSSWMAPPWPDPGTTAEPDRFPSASPASQPAWPTSPRPISLTGDRPADPSRAGPGDLTAPGEGRPVVPQDAPMPSAMARPPAWTAPRTGKENASSSDVTAFPGPFWVQAHFRPRPASVPEALRRFLPDDGSSLKVEILNVQGDHVEMRVDPEGTHPRHIAASIPGTWGDPAIAAILSMHDRLGRVVLEIGADHLILHASVDNIRWLVSVLGKSVGTHSSDHRLDWVVVRVDHRFGV